jgi:predicted  nucleic acid-binding Zn-ribbon protein
MSAYPSDEYTRADMVRDLCKALQETERERDMLRARLDDAEQRANRLLGAKAELERHIEALREMVYRAHT